MQLESWLQGADLLSEHWRPFIPKKFALFVASVQAQLEVATKGD